MNILFVNDIPFNPSLGGIERVTDILTKEFIKNGHRVFYLCGYINETQQSMLDYNFPCPIYILPEPDLYRSQKNLLFYRSLITQLQIDIVINQRGLNSSHNETLIPDVKTISVLHSVPNCYMNYNLQNILQHPNTFKGFLKYILKVICYPYLYHKKKNEELYKLSEQYSYITKKSDAIVLLSNKYKGEFIKHLQEPIKIVKGIPNPNSFYAQKIDLSQKDKMILFVGRLDNIEKSPIRLLKIWKHLHKQYTDWKLVIVGDGVAKQEMIDFISANKLNNVFLEGQQKNVVTYYQKATFICITSNFEGWAMSLTEGMTFGCIPFTFNCYGAASDIIDDNINGCLIKPFDIREYANRLSELMSDENKRKKMAHNANIKVNQFDISNVIKEWIDLLTQVLNTSK